MTNDALSLLTVPPKVLSLDVFDTALIRSCGAPDALYLWLGKRLRHRGVLDCSPEVFARARLLVERAVWAREGGMDARVTIADFYDELVRALYLDPSLTESLIAHELELEEEVLRPTRQSIELLRAIVSHADVRVVFTSDTYFPAAFIERQLVRHGVWPERARCFVSSDLGVSKESGAIFGTMARELDVAPSTILHVGDNLNADVDSARRSGVRCQWLPDGRLNRFEQKLNDARWETGGMAAAFAGASRSVRMSMPAPDLRSRVLRDVAAGVAAPFLSAYLLWIFQRARQLGLERLYFVARDGQVCAELASILNRRLGAGLEIRYLYASRRAINLAAVYDATSAELEWVWRKGDTRSLSTVLRRLDLDLGEVAAALPATWPRDATGEMPVTDDLQTILSTGLTSGPLQALVLGKAAARRELVTEYLGQEGLLDGTRSGVVDLGGVGSQCRALFSLCTSAGAAAPRFFLVNLDTVPESAMTGRHRSWLEHAECYIYDCQRGRGLPSFRGLNTSVQMFCASDHGTVLDYERGDGGVQPVLAVERNPDMVAWGLPTVREALRWFVTDLVVDEELVDRTSDLRPAVCEGIREFTRRPTMEEAEVWGSFPFEGAEISFPTVKPLAAPYEWQAVAREILRTGSFQDQAWNSWPEASWQMSPPWLRQSVQTFDRVTNHRRLRPLRRAASWLRNRFR